MFFLRLFTYQNIQIIIQRDVCDRYLTETNWKLKIAAKKVFRKLNHLYPKTRIQVDVTISGIEVKWNVIIVENGKWILFYALQP